MCRLVRAMLDGLPITVSECCEASRALEACRQVQPDYVVLDFNLSGTEALAVARGILAAHQRTRVLLLGEEDDSRLRDQADLAGVWAFVPKDNLIEVRRLLDPIAQE